MTKKKMNITYNLKRIVQVPAVERKLLMKSYLLCLLIWPVVNLLPLKHYLWLLKSKPGQLSEIDDRIFYIRLVRKTLRRMERFSPVKFSCLVKSITFKMLLNTLGVESNIALGVNNSQHQLLKAHAFVKVNGEVVYLNRKRFNTVYTIE